MTTETKTADLDRFLDDIMPHARGLIAEGHPVDAQLVPDAFDRWLATCEEMVTQRSERSQAALRKMMRRVWTEIREAA